MPGNLTELLTLVRLLAGVPGDQRPAVGHAAEERRLHSRGRAARPQRRRLHLREVRHRHDDARATSARPARSCPGPTCCCSATRAASPSSSGSSCCASEYDCEIAMLHVPYQADGKHRRPRCAATSPTSCGANVIPKHGEDLREEARPRRAAARLSRSAKAEEDLVWVLESGEEQALAHRRLLRVGLLRGAHLHRLPRQRRLRRLLQGAARRGARKARPRRRAGHARRLARQREAPAGGRRPSELDALPRLLAHLPRRRRGVRRLDLHQGRRAVRPGLPPRRRRRPAALARRLLPGLLHEPLAAGAHRLDGRLREGVRGRPGSCSTPSRAATRSPPGSW